MTAAITINFGRPELTLECVESLLADGWSPIVVWDNSTDGGASMRLVQQQFGEMPNVHLAQSSSNMGFGAGMNRALGHLSEHGYSGPTLLINNDAQVVIGLRDALRPYLSRREEPLLVAPRVELAGHEQGWMYYQPWLGLVTAHPFWGSFPYLSGCCLLVNREHNDARLFDESFFMYGEDVELSHRIARQGGRSVLLDGVYVKHVGSASSVMASPFYEYHVARGHWLLAHKLAKGRATKFGMRAIRLISLSARAFIRAARYRSFIPIKAFIKAFR